MKIKKQPNASPVSQDPTPPRWADRLLAWFVAPHLLEDIQGDLHENFYKRIEQTSVTRARQEYSWAALHYLTPFFYRRQQSAYSSPHFLNSSMLRNYLTIAFRTLAYNKTYSIINVVGLSIGLAAAMLIILYTKDEVTYDQFHANNPNIYRITNRFITPEGKVTSVQGNTGFLQGPSFGAGIPEIRSFVRYHEQRYDVKQATQIKSERVFRADSSFFSVFSFPLLSGNPNTALREPNSVVLSEEMAEKQFGTADALGKILYFKDSYTKNSLFEPYTVTGIAQKSPQNSSIKFDILIPFIAQKEDMERSMNWFNTFLNTFVVLKQGANLKVVEAKMNRIYQTEAKEAIKEVAEKYDFKDRKEFMLQPFTEMHLSEDLPANNGLTESNKPMFSYILSGIALFILLIASINFVNLTVARSLKRAKEIGVRKVVGGGRMQLALQFLGESFLLCFGAFLLALLLVQLVLPTFNQLANKALAISYLFDAYLVAGYIGLFLVTGLLAGFYPALVLSGYNPTQTLYSRFSLSGKNYLQQGLVVLQFSIASFLIVGAMTIYSQFNYLITKDLGYDDKHVISIEKSNLTRQEAQLLKTELQQNSGIIAVAPKNGGRWNTSAKINGTTEIMFIYETVDEAYLPLFNISLVDGRNFSPDFTSDSTQSVLVNETFVKKAGWKKPIGQTVDFWYNDEKYTVVGVVKDYHYTALSEEIGPQLFTMKPGNSYGRFFVKIRPNTETASLQHISKTFSRLFPLNPYSFKFLDEENQKRYEAEAKWKQILLFGAILTVFLSCIGLFGLATLSAERRTKEIGIRKVLGASISSVVQLLTSDFLRLVSISFFIAFPVAYYGIKQWLQNYPYRIDISIWTFALTATLAILIAFITVSFQSIKAAMMNPVKSLRSE